MLPNHKERFIRREGTATCPALQVFVSDPPEQQLKVEVSDDWHIVPEHREEALADLAKTLSAFVGKPVTLQTMSEVLRVAEKMVQRHVADGWLVPVVGTVGVA